MKPNKRRTFSNAEKALLLEAYQTSGKLKKPWCKENGISLRTLQRWLRQEKSLPFHLQPQQNWIPVVSTAPEKSKEMEIQLGKCIIPIDRQTDLDLLESVLKVLVKVC